jgi:hypothetical protein
MSERTNVEEWLAARKEEGLKIDPDTAEVDWHYAQTLDPYGVYPDLPEECQCVGRKYFARRREVKYGSTLTIYPTKSVTPFGKDISRNWRSLQG